MSLGCKSTNPKVRQHLIWAEREHGSSENESKLVRSFVNLTLDGEIEEPITVDVC